MTRVELTKTLEETSLFLLNLEQVCTGLLEMLVNLNFG